MRAGNISILGTLLLAVTACGGGGGGSPSAPPPPTTGTGQWAGTHTLVRARPTGHCIARRLNAAAGSRDNVAASLSQSGSSVTGTYRIAGASFQFSGTLVDRRLQGSLRPLDQVIVTCANGEAFTLIEQGNILDGRFDGSLQNFEGGFAARYTVFGFLDVGEITIESSVAIARQ